MSIQNTPTSKRRWFSLPVRIAVGLVAAAIIPLLLMIVYISLQTRPALIGQANKAMASDAQTRVQLINTYFRERLLDAQTLTQVPSVQSFVVTTDLPGSPAYQEGKIHALYSLQAGRFRDKNYSTWSLFDLKGKLLLSYPTEPPKHGQLYVPQTELDTIGTGKSFLSPVYYSPESKKATIEIYSPVFAPQAPGIQTPPNKVTGFLRSTLNLDYIWNDIVQKDLGNNGDGSYAFILDENGVRIADTSPNRRFQAVAPLNQEAQQRIILDERYGTTTTVPLMDDQALSDALKNHDQSTIFQAQITGQNGNFQIVRQSTEKDLIPWNYFVLSPESTETAVAVQQQTSTIILAILASLLVAIVGLFAGRGISRPIMRSVEYLQGNSQALNTLATSQQDAASEQMWVVDSSQLGLQSVQYYTEATKVASRQLREAANGLAQRWQYTDSVKVEQALEHIIEASKYIENASEYQDGSNQKLATALKVATQVTEQLHGGATSASEAAQQLEQIVTELRAVVGR